MGYYKDLIKSESEKSLQVKVNIHYVIVDGNGVRFRSRSINMLDGETCYTDKVLLRNVPKKQCQYFGGPKPMVSYYSDESVAPKGEMLKVLYEGLELDKEDEMRRFDGLLAMVENEQSKEDM